MNTPHSQFRSQLTSMNKEKGDSAINRTPLMDEMHIHFFESIDHHFRLELRKLIQFGFLLFPIESVLPIICQSFYIRTTKLSVMHQHR